MHSNYRKPRHLFPPSQMGGLSICHPCTLPWHRIEWVPVCTQAWEEGEAVFLGLLPSRSVQVAFCVTGKPLKQAGG